jgi:hypothetical protein
MSVSLFWEPGKREKKTCSYALHQTLSKKYMFPISLDKSDLDYLEGLQDAGVEGVEELRNAIVEYGSIDFTEDH